jgi:acyl-CoA thioesterase
VSTTNHEGLVPAAQGAPTTVPRPRPLPRKIAHWGEPGAGNAFAEYLGLSWDDENTVRMTIRPEICNEVGLLLGPVGFALVDYSMGATLWAQTSEGELIATINISINYIQSDTRGDVTCRSRLDRRNRRIAVLSSETHHEDGRLLATAIGSFSIFRR